MDNPIVVLPEPSSTSITNSKVPAFQAMPSSITPIARVAATQAAQIEPRIITAAKSQSSSSLSSSSSQKQAHPNYLQFEEPKFDLKDVTVEELAAAANVSVETIKHAIYVREQQMKAEQRARLAAKLREEFIRTSTTTTSTTTTTTTTTTPRPVMFFKTENDVSSAGGTAVDYEPNVTYENKVSKVSIRTEKSKVMFEISP